MPGPDRPDVEASGDSVVAAPRATGAGLGGSGVGARAPPPVASGSARRLSVRVRSACSARC